MLSLALPDQVQHVVQPGLNKECKAEPFSNILWHVLGWILLSTVGAVTYIFHV